MLKNLIQKFLYELDLFKIPFNLLIKNKRFSSSSFGPVLSIAIFGIVLYLFISSNMILKIHPIAIDQTITTEHAAMIELSNETFNVAAGVADSFGVGYSDPTIFKMQFVHITIDFNETLNSKQIKSKVFKQTEECTPTSFTNQSDFTTLRLNNYTCMKNASFELEGGFDEKIVKSLVVMISYCNNQTDGVICKSQKEIDSFFKGKGLWFYYQDYIYDITNYATPLKQNWRLHTIQVATVPRIIDIYMKKLIFSDDDNFLFPQEKFQFGFMKEKVESLSHYVMIESPLISINLFSSKNNQRTKRQYQKLGDLLANIGGVVNCLMIFGYLITGLENQLRMQNFIMNSLYSFSYEKKEKLTKKNLGESPKLKAKTLNDHKDEDSQYNWNKDYEELKSHSKYIGELKNEESHKQLVLYDNKFSKDSLRKDKLEEENFVPLPSEKKVERFNLVDLTENCSKINQSLGENQSKFNSPRIDIDKKNLKNKPSSILVNSPSLKPKERRVNTEQQPQNKTDVVKEEDNSLPVSLSFLQYFKLYTKVFCRRALTSKEKLFLISRKKFKKETDICYLLEKIQELEKLKLIIFDSAQLDVFNLISKPLIYLENPGQNTEKTIRHTIIRQTGTNLLVKNDAKKRIFELKSEYYKLLKKKDQTLVDKNLIKMIQEDIFA